MQLKWVENAKLFLSQLEKGMSYAEIAEKADVSESKVKRLVETYKIRDVPRATELEYPVARTIYLNAWRNLWLYDAEEELPILVNHVLEKKLDEKKTLKISLCYFFRSDFLFAQVSSSNNIWNISP